MSSGDENDTAGDLPNRCVGSTILALRRRSRVQSIPALNAALRGQYVVERELGAGGMAIVYLARDVRHDRLVALKVLNPELSASIGERFSREIAITAHLQHPNILPVFDSGTAAGSHWYTMPYVDGESVRARLIRERQLPIDDAVRIAREIGDALALAHSKQLVHRDVKPENILLSQGHAVLADFGIARSGRGEGISQITQAGVTIGTPQYMSPEQASGEHELDGRSDVYALGCVLYEMLAGEPPFPGASVQSIIAKHVGAAIPSVRTLRPDVPVPLDRAIQRALAKPAASRWSTASDFVSALGQSSKHGVRRRTVALAALGVIALVVAVLVADRAPWFNHSRPVVVLMDSPHPSRVYDSTTRLANGTNADVLSDLLADLPIRIQKETIGPSWHREEEVRLFDPDWIVIHYSGFCQETCTDRTRLRQLVESFAESKTRFLIYSRSRGDSLRHGVDTLLRVVDSTHRGALRRVYTFGLRDHGGPYWRDPMTAAAFKLRFRQLLNNAK